MESIEKMVDNVKLLFCQDDCLAAVTAMAVVETGENPAQERTRLQENQGARQERVALSSHMDSHVEDN